MSCGGMCPVDSRSRQGILLEFQKNGFLICFINVDIVPPTREQDSCITQREVAKGRYSLGFMGQSKVYPRNQVNQPRMAPSDWSTHHRTSSWPPFRTMYLAAATQLDESPFFGQFGRFYAPRPTRTKHRRQSHQTHTNARPNTNHSNDPRADIPFRPVQIGTHSTFLSPLTATHANTHHNKRDMSVADEPPLP